MSGVRAVEALDTELRENKEEKKLKNKWSKISQLDARQIYRSRNSIKSKKDTRTDGHMDGHTHTQSKYGSHSKTEAKKLQSGLALQRNNINIKYSTFCTE